MAGTHENGCDFVGFFVRDKPAKSEDWCIFKQISYYVPVINSAVVQHALYSSPVLLLTLLFTDLSSIENG
jgi:hypothetical protein